MTEEPRRNSYAYGERVVEDMEDRSFRPGTGRISGYLSSFLGVMSFLAVLCFRYPSYLTTPELRDVYDVDLLKLLLKICMWTSLATGVFTFVRNKRKRMGAVGVVFTALAFSLGGYGIDPGDVDPAPVFAGVDWMVLDLLVSGLVFIFIEKVIPKYPDQAVLRPEWRVDLAYFCVNHILVGVLLLIGNGFAPTVFGWAVNDHVRDAVLSLPVAAQVVVLVFCADLVQYWVHRAYHEIPFLWKLHAVHHSTEHVDWLSGSRNHVVQTLIDRSLIMVPLYLLGPSQDALDLYVVLAAFQAVFVHANVGIPFGPLKYLIVTPQFHHWHHSKDKPAIDTNYAVHLPLMDFVFRSFHLPKKHWPLEYGTVSRLPRTFLGQLAYPFRPQRD